MTRKPKIVLADPLDFDREADVRSARDGSDLPGADVLLTTAELAKRWRVTPGAIMKQRQRNQGPPFIALSRHRIVYRLSDVRDFESNRFAFTHGQARAIGLL